MDSFAEQAVQEVLDRLGEETSVDLKQKLARDYGIRLDNMHAFRLEDLESALGDLVGGYSSAFLMREIHREIEMLARQLPH